MPLLDESQVPLVPLDFMNRDRREETRLLNDLADAMGALRAGRGEAQEVTACLAALFEHTRDHFRSEEAAMQRAAFPAHSAHKEEHDRVLQELADEGGNFAETGDAERLWRYVSETLPSWLLEHIESMDLVTARFVTAREAETT